MPFLKDEEYDRLKADIRNSRAERDKLHSTIEELRNALESIASDLRIPVWIRLIASQALRRKP